ncbi:MAG: complex I subunit 5 family protein [bacterium]
MTSALYLFLLVPLVAGVLVALMGKRSPAVADALATLAAGVLSLMALVSVGKSGILWITGGVPPQGTPGMSLVLDGPAVVMLITTNLIGLAGALYSIAYVERALKVRHHALLMLSLAGANWAVLAGDLVGVLVAVAMVSAAAYAMLAHRGAGADARAASKYLVAAGIGVALVLAGMLVTYGSAHSVNMAQVAKTVGTGPTTWHLLALALFLVGLGLQAGMFPFHGWLVGLVDSAPTSFSATLCGVLMKAVGVFAMMRVLFNALGATPTVLSLLLVLGALSIIIGALAALAQNDLKRVLSYHTISETGFVLLGLGLGTRLGIAAALFHMMNVAVAKTLLFMNAGSLEHATGGTSYDRLGDVKHKLPVVGATSTIGALSLSGIPPFGGFWSKLFILVAVVQAERYGYAAWMVAGSILTIASMARFQKVVLHDQAREGMETRRAVPALMQAVAVVLTALCFSMGLLWLPRIQADFFMSAAKVIQEGVTYGANILGM